MSIARRRHNGASSDRLVARIRGSSCATRHCAIMWRRETGWRRRRSERGSCSRPGRVLERTSAWTAAGASVGQGMEPGADCSPLADRFPDDGTMRISHAAIYQALFVQARGALRRELAACLRTGRTCVACPASAYARPRQDLYLARDYDQPTSCGSYRPGGTGTLGGRPHPRTWQFGDWHSRGTHDAVHDAAAPAAHDGPWP